MITNQQFSAYSEKSWNAFIAAGLEQKFAYRTAPIKNDTDGDDDAGSEANEPVEIVIYDIIGTFDTNAQTFQSALAQANGADVVIRLSSPGGSVFEGWAMYNQLKNYTGNSTVVVDGVCASIATIFALGADTVQTAETSLWMIHNAWTFAIGNANDFLAQADVLTKIDGNLKAVYAAKSNTTADDWTDIMSAETWYTSNAIVEAGLCDGICAPPAKSTATTAKAEVGTDIKAEITTENAPEVDANELFLAQARVRLAIAQLNIHD